MKSRICVRSMGLGAVIMLIGLAVGAIVSPPLIAHGGAGVIGVLGEIVCTGLTVIDKNGNKVLLTFHRNQIIVATKLRNPIYRTANLSKREEIR